MELEKWEKVKALQEGHFIDEFSISGDVLRRYRLVGDRLEVCRVAEQENCWNFAEWNWVLDIGDYRIHEPGPERQSLESILSQSKDGMADAMHKICAELDRRHAEYDRKFKELEK